MNTPPRNGFSSPPDRDPAGEDTLRLLASLPAPEGLADRVKAGLRTAPRAGRVLLWRAPLGTHPGWMYSGLARGAAAAAIVCVVAGGGWRIYSHVQPAAAPQILAMPAPASSGFSSAGAMRVPDTLQRPVLKNPPAPVPEVNVIEKMPPPAGPVPGARPLKKKHPLSRPAPQPVQ
jgi:hypothetical protein